MSKTLSFPSSKDILAACRQSDGAGAEKSSELLLSKLNLLLHALEGESTQKAAIANLHDLADKLSEEQFASLTIKTVSLPSLAAPIRLFLTPAVFSPELWGRTFAEGLLKSKEQFHGKRVVEVGTGSGWISLLLLFVTHVQEVLGLDLNPVAVTMARLNAWLNGTTADGAYVLSLAGEPIVKVFQAEVSDLLGAPLASQRKFDHVIGCIPQVLHPNPVKLGRDNQQAGLVVDQAEAVVQQEGLSEKDLYDLSNYCFEQGILEDRFGLPLIARALEQSQLCLASGGRVTLVLGGRPGRQAIESMFDRRGFDTRLVWMRRIQQADDTDLASLVELEREYGIRFHFFMSRDSEQSISAATAVRLLTHGQLVYHDLLVYQADTRFEKEIFSFVRNLSQLGLESLRKELDFSRLADEQVSFISRLSSSLLKIKAIPYPHERGDKSLRETIARYLRGFCYYPIEADELFIAPSRPQLVDMVLRLAARKGDTVLLSSSLVEVYEKCALGAQLDLVVGNDDLSELQELEDLVEPALVLIAPKQLQSPSPLTFKALCQKARSHPERIYIIDDSQGFDISSELGSNMTLRFAGQEPLPPNLVLLYGLIKNSISRDLELSFLINAPHIWLEGLDIGAELSYSRIAHPTQLLYEWLFNDLMTFPFPDQIQDNQRTHQKGTEVKAELSELIQELAADPVFAPKPIDLETPGLLRLDYGEFEAPVPDILVKGLFKGFLDNENTFLPEIVSDRVCAYMKWTRKVSLSPNRVTLAQGVFALFGALIKTLTARLGRPCVVAVPDGSYGPLYPMLKYYGARVLPIKTQSERAFLLSQKIWQPSAKNQTCSGSPSPIIPAVFSLTPSACATLLKLVISKIFMSCPTRFSSCFRITDLANGLLPHFHPALI